ncbi:hypothetical protein GCM10027048_08550 [Hymenobacter coalescens]
MRTAVKPSRALCLPRRTTTSFVGVSYYRHYSWGDTVARQFEATRWGAFLGASAFANPHAVFGGLELAGTYRLAPQLQAELAGTIAIPTRIRSSLGVAETAKPMLGLYSIAARTNIFLIDNPRLRTAVIAGAGLGAATLADRSQQIADDSQPQSCGCEPSTHAKVMATSVGLVGLAGASATFKLSPDSWLTTKAYYQQWAGATGFGTQRDLSAWVFSVGVTMPDRWR